MTCIAAVAHKGIVYMGADTCISAGGAWDTSASPKIIRKHDLLIGCAGSIRGTNLINHALEIPKADSDADAEKWLVNVFIERLRKCFIAGGHAVKENVQESMECTLLIGFRGQIFSIYENYLVTKHAHEFGSIGSGEDVAHGSLFSTRGKPPRVRIKTALLAAERFTTKVRQPFTIKKLNGSK